MTLRNASTLLLLRGRTAPLEVLMIRRSEESFGGGWWVFPGGVVDPADLEPERTSILSGSTTRPGPQSADLTTRPGDAAWIVAAIRETAEEVGLCLTTPPLRPDAWSRDDVVGSVRAAGARFDGEGIVCLSNWITPEGVSKRYDTRFYVAEWTGDDEGEPDGFEVTDCEWVDPTEMLARDREAYPLIFPTIKHLELLVRFDRPADVVAHARATPVEPIQPRAVDGGGFIRLLMPGDPGYEDAPREVPT